MRHRGSAVGEMVALGGRRGGDGYGGGCKLLFLLWYYFLDFQSYWS